MSEYGGSPCASSRAVMPREPDVSFVIIARLLDDFRGHPEGCADEGVLLGHCGGELAGDAEVCKLDLSVGAQENIGSYVKGSAWSLLGDQTQLLLTFDVRCSFLSVCR